MIRLKIAKYQRPTYIPLFPKYPFIQMLSTNNFEAGKTDSIKG